MGLESSCRKEETATSPKAHDQWLQALRGPDGVIDGGPPELAVLAAQVCEWRRPFSLDPLAVPSLFSLKEPPEATQGNGEALRKRRDF